VVARSVTVQDGGSNLIGKTTFAYDEKPITPSQGTPPQHVSMSGSRGNLTTISHFSSAANSLNSQYTYYDTGTVNVATDVNGATTTYSYSCISYSEGCRQPSLMRST
jgi:hypothetical protein